MDDSSCPICLVDITDETNLKYVSKQECCKKIFHKECIQEWLKLKQTCPWCRTKTKEDEEQLIKLRKRMQIVFSRNAVSVVSPDDANNQKEKCKIQ